MQIYIFKVTQSDFFKKKIEDICPFRSLCVLYLHPRPSNNLVEIWNWGFSQAYLLQMYMTNDTNIEQDDQPSKFSLLACTSLF